MYSPEKNDKKLHGNLLVIDGKRSQFHATKVHRTPFVLKIA